MVIVVVFLFFVVIVVVDFYFLDILDKNKRAICVHLCVFH